MTCVRKSARSRWSSRAIVWTAALLAAIALPLGDLAAQGASAGGIKQFQRQFMIGGRLPAAILIVGYAKDTRDIEKLLDIVSTKAAESYARLDWQNPQGDVAKVNAAAGQGPVAVSEDVLSAFQAAEKIANWTGGAFDIIAEGSGNYRDISMKEGASTVELKKPGLSARFDPMMEGFLAELMLRYIYAASMQNAMVKVGLTFRGVGQAIMGPWKIQVQDDAGTYARHALNLTVANTAIATVSASQYAGRPLIDPRSRNQVSPPCRGVTVLTNDAAEAQGIAQAVFLMGPGDGMKFLNKLGRARALIVDNDGKFHRTPGF